MDDTKFIINKYKNKSFKEVKEIILTTDNKYFSFLQRSLLKDNTNKKKKDNIEAFLKYWDSNNTTENIPDNQNKTTTEESNEEMKSKELEKYPKQIINTDIEKVSKVYHISDVHIRLYSRFDEYQFVFNNLYKLLESHKETFINSNETAIIVITGDLLHSKNQLSPECILFTYQFLRSLGNIFPTFLIAGNHDALLTNNQRIDSITAIIKNRSIPNLHYLKDSGCYHFANICFGVCSLLDDKWVYAEQLDIDEDKNMTKVALYHGGVGEFETGVGFRMRGEKLIKDFNGYDFVMLGDIHKFQFLDEDRDRIAYASSLVAQNFSECDTNHGVLVWDTIHKNHEYFKIENESGFMIFRLENEKIFPQKGEQEINIDEIEQIKLPNNLNLKLIIKNSSQVYIKKIVKILRNNTSDLKVHYNFIHSEEETIMPLTSNNSSSDDFTSYFNEDNVNKWIEHYLKLRKKIPDESLIKKICEKFQEYNTDKLNIKEKSICRWELISLQFSNLFSYGEDNFIDFSKFNDSSVIGVLAPNSYGKSSLIDIILFSLFGRISRNQGHGISKDLINVSKDKFDTCLSFRIGSENYIIEKEGRREKSGKIKITKEEFYKFKNNEKIILTEESRIKTDKILNEHIGDMQEFIFTNIQLQNRDKSFKDLTNKERKEFLHNILNLDVFEAILPAISADTKSIKTEHDLLEKSLKNCSIEDLETNKSDTEKHIIELDTKLDDYQILSDEFIVNIEELRNKLYFIDDNLIQVSENSIEELIEKQEKEKVIYHDLNEKNKIEITDNKQQLKMLKILKNKNKIIKEYKKFTEEKEKSISEMENNIAKLEKKKTPESNLDIFYEQLELENNANLNEYRKNIDQIIKEKIDENVENKIVEDNTREKLLDYQKDNDNILTKIKKESERVTNEINDLSSQIWKFDSDDLKFLKKDLSSKDEKRTELKKLSKKILKSLESLEKEIIREVELKFKIKEIVAEKNIKDEIKSLQDDLSLYDKILAKFKNHEYDPKCKYCMSNSITTELTEAKEKKEITNKQISKLQEKIKYSPEEVNDIESELVEINGKKSELKEKKLEQQINQNEIDKIDELFTKMDKLKKQKKSNKSIRADIDESKNKLEENKKKESNINSEINSLNKKLKEISDEINNNKIFIDENKRKILLIDKLEKGIFKNRDISENNRVFDIEISEIKVKLQDKKEETLEEYDHLMDQIDLKDKLDQNIEDLNDATKNNSDKIDQLSLSLINNQDKIKKLHAMITQKEENDNIYEEIDLLSNKHKDVTDDILKLREEKGYYTNQIETITNQIETFNNSFSTYLQVKEKYSINKYLEECIGRDGVPLMLLEQYLPAIQQHINEIIQPFINRQISITLHGDTINFESIPTYSEYSVMIHGGMESFILDLAFKITLSKYAMLPKCDTLFLDEGISAFDKEKLSTIDTLFNFLKNHFNKIILITHIDQVKDHINEKIEIEKNGNDSHIVCFYG
jgi:DNA repair protein SbcC/Rad50